VLASYFNLQSAPFKFRRGQSGLVGIPKHHVVSKLCLYALKEHLRHLYAKCQNSCVVQSLYVQRMGLLLLILMVGHLLRILLGKDTQPNCLIGS
jgi:hypothetical protein